MPLFRNVRPRKDCTRPLFLATVERKARLSRELTFSMCVLWRFLSYLLLLLLRLQHASISFLSPAYSLVRRGDSWFSDWVIGGILVFRFVSSSQQLLPRDKSLLRAMKDGLHWVCRVLLDDAFLILGLGRKGALLASPLWFQFAISWCGSASNNTMFSFCCTALLSHSKQSFLSGVATGKGRLSLESVGVRWRSFAGNRAWKRTSCANTERNHSKHLSKKEKRERESRSVALLLTMTMTMTMTDGTVKTLIWIMFHRGVQK